MLNTKPAPYAPGDVIAATPHDDEHPGVEQWNVTIDGPAGPLTCKTTHYGVGYGPGVRIGHSSAPRVGREVVAKPSAPGIPAALVGQVLTIARVCPAADELGGWFLTLTHQGATTYALHSDTWPPPPCHGQVGPPFHCPRCEETTAVYLQEAWSDTTQCINPGCGYRETRPIGD